MSVSWKYGHTFLSLSLFTFLVACRMSASFSFLKMHCFVITAGLEGGSLSYLSFECKTFI